MISGKIRSNILDLVTMTYKYLIAGLSSPCYETSQAKGLRMDVFYVKIQTDRLCILFSFTEYNKIEFAVNKQYCRLSEEGGGAK